MLKISHISKTFNPGTVNEKKAIEEIFPGTDKRRLCYDHRFQWCGKINTFQRNLR